MKPFIKSIQDKNLTEAKKLFEQRVVEIVNVHLIEAKKHVAATMCEGNENKAFRERTMSKFNNPDGTAKNVGDRSEKQKKIDDIRKSGGVPASAYFKYKQEREAKGEKAMSPKELAQYRVGKGLAPGSDKKEPEAAAKKEAPAPEAKAPEPEKKKYDVPDVRPEKRDTWEKKHRAPDIKAEPREKKKGLLARIKDAFKKKKSDEPSSGPSLKTPSKEDVDYHKALNGGKINTGRASNAHGGTRLKFKGT